VSEKKEREQPTAESTLGPQLGSDIEILSKMHKVDMRRLSKLGPIDKAWLSYFTLLEPEEGGDFAKASTEHHAKRLEERGRREGSNDS